MKSKKVLFLLSTFICTLSLIGCKNKKSSTATPSTEPTSSVTSSETPSVIPSEETISPSESKEEIISTTGVDLNTHYVDLSLGSTYMLKATISPSEATDKNVFWTSDNNDIAMVNNGKVTTISLGKTYINVYTEDGNYTDRCLVKVTSDNIPVAGISLNYEEAELKVGKTLTLVTSIEPYNATNQGVSWSSSDESVVSVNDGVVTGISEGSATITVTTDEGGFQASCVFTVSKSSSGGEGYNPDTTDSDIYILTSDVLSDDYLNSDGEYEYSVTKNYKQIYINAPEAKIVLSLEGVTIENNENSPIYVEAVDSLDISAKKETINYVKDTRNIYSEDIDSQGKGAIYVNDGDLTLKGKGQLDITANYLNGVHVKDDVKVKNLTLNITAVNNGIKGSDSVTITSGVVNILCGGDGLHSDNSDLSSKGNQRGDITINGGSITINAFEDGIQAAYNTVIDQADDSVPTSVNIATNKYSTYDGETVDTSTSSFYIKMNSSTYSYGNYTYAAYINNAWYKANYKGQESSGNQGGPGGGGPGGGSRTYYIYEIEKPKGATSFTLYRFSGSDVTTYSTSSYNAKSETKTFNDNYDMVQISVSGSVISFSNWSNYASNGGSSKGIKAENEIYIKNGDITIHSYDDAIHANNDGSLENGSSPLGNVNISGGNIVISTSDDAIHADYILSISGGHIEVKESYEGLEGNVLNISGGESYVYASDDGVNASSGKVSASITVSGGYLDVEVPSNGDTDGIDSNGTYTQSGGVVIVKGPGKASSTNFGAAALDTDSTVRITSGTLIVFGDIEQTPSSSVTKTLCSSSTVSTGSHTISFSSSSYTTTLKTSTNGCVVYSSLGTASLK